MKTQATLRLEEEERRNWLKLIYERPELVDLVKEIIDVKNPTIISDRMIEEVMSLDNRIF